MMKRYLGIDLGGTSMRVAIVLETGEVVEKISMPTEVEKGPTDVIERLAMMVKQIDPENEFSTVGFGMPGPLDLKKGCMLDAPNFPNWAFFPIVSTLERLMGKKVILENDANVAGIGEAFAGGGKEAASVVFMTISTGVGGGIVIQNRLLSGANGYGGEIGCMIISSEDRHHPTLPKGSLESLCSGSALSKIAQELFGETASAADIFKAYQNGNKEAKGVVQVWIENVAKALGTLQQIIDPAVFVLGGSVILHNQWLCPLIEVAAKKYVYASLAEHIHVKVAQLGADAGLVGAAFLTKL